MRVYRRHAQQAQQEPKLPFFFQFVPGQACDLRYARQSNVIPEEKQEDGLIPCKPPSLPKRIVQVSQPLARRQIYPRFINGSTYQCQSHVPNDPESIAVSYPKTDRHQANDLPADRRLGDQRQRAGP